MNRVLYLGLIACAFAIAACGGGDNGDGGVRVEVKTPVAGGPTATPTVDPSIQIEPPELVVSTVSPFQGGAILVSVVGDVSGGTIEAFGRQHTLIQGSQSKFSFIGVDVEQEPGPYTFEVAFTLINGTTGTLPIEVTVLATDWTVDSLVFDESQEDRFLDARVIADEEAQLREVYSIDSDTKLWDGPWQLPYDGPVTARFGEQRRINGGLPEGHHSGTDFGGPAGEPVGATNHGMVVMARQMERRGNFVVIDHGGGVLSGYGHLQQFAVAEGQRVEPGQTIGHIGNTGLSTGAHLHWEMAVDGVLVDPLRFFDGSNGF